MDQIIPVSKQVVEVYEDILLESMELNDFTIDDGFLSVEDVEDVELLRKLCKVHMTASGLLLHLLNIASQKKGGKS